MPMMPIEMYILSRDEMPLRPIEIYSQSESNKTKVRTTVSARNCVADMDEASHIIANWRGCLEAVFKNESTRL